MYMYVSQWNHFELVYMAQWVILNYKCFILIGWNQCQITKLNNFWNLEQTVVWRSFKYFFVGHWFQANFGESNVWICGHTCKLSFVYSDMLWRNAIMSYRDAKLAELKKKTLEIDIIKSRLKCLRVLRYLCNLCEICSIVLWMPIPLVVLLKMKITILSAK